MKVALDAMGGDYAPREIVIGAFEALKTLDIELVLVGLRDKLQSEIEILTKQGLIDSEFRDRLEILDCSQVIEMDEEPVRAMRKKKDASIVVATQLVKNKQADAVISAGSTGAQMVTALFILGRISGIERPAIATVIPGINGPKVLLDSGANVDCRPNHLEYFGLMGSVYASTVLGFPKPKVALLNVGEEESKGNELSKQAYQLLKESQINFIGNLEGRELLSGAADIIVCDGFVGNVVLKLTEGLSQMLLTMIQEALREPGSDTNLTSIMPGLKKIKNRLDYAEYGGAPLLGVDGISIICHGSSRGRAIFNAIKVAKDSVEKKLVEKLKSGISRG